MLPISLSATVLGLFLAPVAAYTLTLPADTATQPPAARSMAGRALVSSVRVCGISMMQNLDGTGSFRDIQEYPCDLDIKVIGNNEGPFVQDIVQLAAENTGMDIDDIQVRWRDNGKYRAITLRLHFENSDQVYATYAAMDRDPRVKFKL